MMNFTQSQEIETAFEKAALAFLDHLLDTMATDMSEPAIVTPNWEMIEFIEEENKRIKDLRNATKLEVII
jgi:hypothetical protein